MCVLEAAGLLNKPFAALDHDWKKPEITSEPHILIEGGRHPLLAAATELEKGSGFIPNDTKFAAGKASIQVLTGNLTPS